MKGLSFRRILVPTDLSECSDAAMGPARRFAELTGAEILLLNVVDHGLFYGSAYLSIDPHAILMETAQRNLKALERMAGEWFPGLRVRCLVKEGATEETIVEEARRERSDLIVMSTHGHTGFRHWLLGGVAEHIVRLAPCPVLTVKPEGKGEAREGAAAAGGRAGRAE
jgi:nucleotide-binding universal stress UspA family protein